MELRPGGTHQTFGERFLNEWEERSWPFLLQPSPDSRPSSLQAQASSSSPLPSLCALICKMAMGADSWVGLGRRRGVPG